MEGREDVYGEPGADTIYVISDGTFDEIYCADKDMPNGDPGDKLFYVGTDLSKTDYRLPGTNPPFQYMDHVNYCPAAQLISPDQFNAVLAAAKKTPPSLKAASRFLPGNL